MKLRSLLFFLMALPAMMWAQTTTSSMSGFVKTTDGEPLVGATVSALHEPTGTSYKTQSRSGGRFDIANMNIGGPYTVTVSFINFVTGKQENIFLNLGEAGKVDFKLGDKKAELAGVTVVANKNAASSGKGGSETNIGRDKMENLPTVGRNLSDYLRAVPQAKLTSAEGGISIAGQNNRLNAFYIDGAVNNDVFGLSNSGTNGGQTGGSPISIDAIDQFQVVISPFDVSLGNFTGGGINATTRGGTNQTRGSIYNFFRNQDLAGKNPIGDKAAATKLPDFTNKTYGFRVGGPLIKNKLFYFVSLEQQRDIRPQPFVFSQYTGVLKVDELNALRDTIRRKYNYDAGGFLDNPDKLEADRIAAKIDWNISDNHKLSLSYRYNKMTRNNTNASTSTSINFYNNGYVFPSTTNSFSGELKSNLGKGLSNKLLLTYTRVVDDRNPIGDAFPRIQIFDGSSASLFIGPDNSSTINKLDQKNLSIFDRVLWNLGKHQVSAGVDFEFNDAYNAFIQNTFGNYRYSSITDFYTNAKPNQYIYGFSQLDNKGDATESAAKFKTMRLGFFLGDEYKASQNFSLTYGVRADYFSFVTTPITDTFTNNIAIPKFSQYYDLGGARSGLKPKLPVALSPRIGIVYKIPEEGVTIRGGVGIFVGRVPLVWPGGVYNNNGTSIGGYTASSSQNAAALNTIRFRPDPNGQWKPNEVGISVTKGGLNLITAEFKLPKIFRASAAIDKNLGSGWNLTFEGILTKNINEIYYTNINILPPTAQSAGPGSRNIYPIPVTIPINANGSNPYDNAILLSNNKGDKGFAYNFTFTVDKRFTNGFSFNANYAYGNSVVVNELTSSVNLSQWRFMETVNGRNYIGRSASDFDQGHRIFAFASKKFTYANKKLATTVSLVYNGQSGNPFSYVYQNSMTRDDGTSGGNDLIYVPTSSEITGWLGNNQFLSNTVSGTIYTPTQQAAALDQYISNDKYLKKRRGQFAERNGGRLPFTHVVDLKIAQDLTLKFGKNRYQIQVSYDVFNFTNMLNRDWGRSNFLSNDSYQIISFAGYSTIAGVANTPTYRFNPLNNSRTPYTVSTSVVPAYSARWISQLGVRLNFN
ncbi:MAG: TonB-dependent receptor [Chitinophagaceae bacterium]